MRDPRRAREELGADADSYAAYRAFLGRIAPFARRTFDRVPVDVIGKEDRRPLGSRQDRHRPPDARQERHDGALPHRADVRGGLAEGVV